MKHHGRLGLTGTFALQSALVVGVMTVAIGAFSTSQVERTVVASVARSVASPMVAAVTHGLTRAQVEDMRPGDFTHFDELVRTSFPEDEIREIKVWNAHGEVVYSTEAEAVGESYPDDANVRRALAGELVYSVDEGADAESEREHRLFGRVIEVYAPIRTADGRVTGIVESYMSYSSVQAVVLPALGWVWAVAALGGVVIYLVQIRIARAAEKRLKESEAEVDVVNRRLAASMRDIESHSMGTLRALTAAVDAKDSYTARHSLGVADYAQIVGRRLDLPDEDLLDLERAGLLHDVGKIGVAEAVLCKPEVLTREEYEIVMDHSDIGARIIESIPFLERLVPIVRYHHERWDGTGYPEGLSGESIPKLARILSVADAYDAMTSDRPYRAAIRARVAREELERGRGTQFDPEAVDALLEALEAGAREAAAGA